MMYVGREELGRGGRDGGWWWHQELGPKVAEALFSLLFTSIIWYLYT